MDVAAASAALVLAAIDEGVALGAAGVMVMLLGAVVVAGDSTATNADGVA